MYTIIKEKHLFITLLCSLGLLLASCGDSSTSPGNGNGNGNGNGSGEPPEPVFTNVLEIFNSSCAGSGCHVGERTNGVRLDSYDNVMNSNGQQYGGPVVVEGEPGNSPLVDKIEEDPGQGDRMPRGGPYLSDEEISLIRDWIDEGAQDN